ncbi:hypothetical protein [Aquidulcibacter paucihalophilus]|nr:hypothetical protein [Aquidulcibacter paucihalophilus]
MKNRQILLATAATLATLISGNAWAQSGTASTADEPASDVVIVTA